MSYRDDHDAALARIHALETELAQLQTENRRLEQLVIRLEVDASVGRELRRARELDEQDETSQEVRLRLRMEREQLEVEAAMEAAERLAAMKNK